MVWLLGKLLCSDYTLPVRLARSGMASREWLRRHPEAARAAGYVLVAGKLPL